jgi:hypothetical protein
VPTLEGYTPLMENDKEGTVKTLTAYRGDMTSLIRDHSLGFKMLRGK